MIYASVSFARTDSGRRIPRVGLKPHSDVRSSNHLKTAATEFAIKGLELDWVDMFRGADILGYHPESHHKNLTNFTQKIYSRFTY